MRLSISEGKYLMTLARRAIFEYIVSGKRIKADKKEGVLCEKRGVFVTLSTHPSHELRGCIGHPLPVMPLAEAVIENARHSAFSDPRFPPVQKDELALIAIEISVLDVPEIIKVKTPLEYPKKIKVGRDGLIVKSGWYSGLLLPQVPVEWGWKEEEFLSQTCAKANLPTGAWKEGKVEILKFSAQIFSEETPGGKVAEKKIQE
ncbi:AMMECR1 domain-containing protein [Candidatus Micrarchaeota archaeon CG11_big_fil_rev_8_21_14_0_20_47_5]|nr:MAG: hypothetical protein AUJ17_01800 [Candidatus Micrarchaeota archaeon CG1_02_47_40]PIN83124.1 MAG: AMMECR1 domain-containing protein [Candidatus Micrarchaeota archaeon CG11_big_fil_rev_8_21_14_0_20_47_5]